MAEFRFSSAVEAEAAFYGAFASALLTDMMRVWAEEAPVVCIHPMGPRLADREAIAESWRRIFAGAERLHVEPREVLVCAGASVAMHAVNEHLAAPDGRRGTVHATNVYRLTEHGWRMVMHHASPAGAAAARTPEPAPQVH